MGIQLLPLEQYNRWFTDEQKKLTKDRKRTVNEQTGRPSSVAQKQMAKQGYTQGDDGVRVKIESIPNIQQWASSMTSESETEAELACLTEHGTRPILRAPMRGLRLTESTDAILQASIVANPKPTVHSLPSIASLLPQIHWLHNGQPLRINGSRIQATYKGKQRDAINQSPRSLQLLSQC